MGPASPRTANRGVVARHRRLGKIPQGFFYFFTIVSVLVALAYLFNWQIGGWYIRNISYYFLLMGLLFPFAFLFIPARREDFGKIPWYDWIAAFAGCVIPIYFCFRADDIWILGWAYYIPTHAVVIGIIFLILVLEAARRAGGNIFCIIVLIFVIYPLIAGIVPGFLRGTQFAFTEAIGQYLFGTEGLLGLPMRVVGEILIGFLVFAGIVVRGGAGQFFLTLATAIAGGKRGGAAKVAVLGSAFFGSLSGSVLANVVATGSFTIPAMKRTGYPPEYAGAVEACASTGGIIMPPVMGAAAFVMAEFTGIPYATIMVAAAIPSVLYFLGLLLQVDSYAARVGLKGLPREQLPSLWHTLKQGWHFLFAVLFLVWGLVYMRWEALTPFYASVLLIVLSMLRKGTRLDSPRKWASIVDEVGKLLVEMTAIILPLGLIVAGLVITGTAPALTAQILGLSDTPFVVLLLGAIVCYLLGMTGLLTPAYIFLAVSLAPGMVQLGFNVLAVHLFILYYAMLAAITPPVALASFLAARMAGASPMRTALRAMRIGVVIYFIPFFFVFEPSLVLQGSGLDTLRYFSAAALGIVLIAGGIEGYLLGIGRLGAPIRAILTIAGTLVAFPLLTTELVGAVLAVLAVLFITLVKIKKKVPKRATLL